MSTITTLTKNELSGFKLSNGVYSVNIPVAGITQDVFENGAVIVSFAPPTGGGRAFYTLPFTNAPNYCNFYYVKGIVNINTNFKDWADGSTNYKICTISSR